MRFTLALVLILLLSGFASAGATCAMKGYKSSCSCVAGGGSDCWEAGKTKGIACMAVAYPEASIKYWANSCKPLEYCVNDLKDCQSIYCSGSDTEKCKNVECQTCHYKADQCAVKAASCSGCGDGTCDKDAGENQGTCCLDCGCSGVLQCNKELFGKSKCDISEEDGMFCVDMMPFIVMPLLSLAGALAAKVLLLA